MCLFPNCKSHPQPNGYCIGHSKHGAVVVKVKKEIPKRSEGMKEKMKEYKPKMIAFLAKNKRCKMNMEGCTKVAVCVHHVFGRIGDKLMDEKGWMPACANCNLTAEIKDLEARSKGLKKSKHVKPN
jgi:hypothetical protein